MSRQSRRRSSARPSYDPSGSLDQPCAVKGRERVRHRVLTTVGGLLVGLLCSCGSRADGRVSSPSTTPGQRTARSLVVLEKSADLDAKGCLSLNNSFGGADIVCPLDPKAQSVTGTSEYGDNVYVSIKSTSTYGLFSGTHDSTVTAMGAIAKVPLDEGLQFEVLSSEGRYVCGFRPAGFPALATIGCVRAAS